MISDSNQQLYSLTSHRRSSSIPPGTDGLIVMFKMKNTDGYFFDILFSNDDVYYATLMTDVGMYLSKQVYNDEVNEARERLKDALQR